MDISDRTFYSATSTKKDWRDVVSELSCELEEGSGNLGIIYLSEDLLVSLENIIKELKNRYKDGAKFKKILVLCTY